MAQALLQPVVPVEILECPICLEVIDGFKNRVTTECGHTFHCRCLLTNAAHNGFGCPFCRTELADVVEESDDEDEYDEDEYTPARYDDNDDDASRASDYDDDDDDFENEIEYMYHRITQMEEDHLLRGFRWMFQPLNVDVEEVNINVDLEEAVVNLEEAVVNLDDDDVTVWETDSECEDISAAEVDNEQKTQIKHK